ncbi:MAG TPA: hypothetical protein VI485_21215 [Vicinamibacterales bacterium]|nr:hypothetical protein [Vicinamibacterales bacterium]
MRPRTVCALLLTALSMSLVRAQPSPDGAIVAAMQQSNRALRAVQIWRRVALEDGLDLVLALGAETPGGLMVQRNGPAMLIQKLGLFLQDRAQPGRVFTLTVDAYGAGGCGARILRATATDTVIACSGEKSEVQPSQKFVYDVRAKRLVSHFEYMPFRGFQVTRLRGDRAHFLAANETHQVTVDFSAGRAPEFRVLGKTNRMPLPDPATGAGVPTGVEPAPFRAMSPRFGPSGAFTLVELDEDTECADASAVVLETRGRRQQRHSLPPSGCDRIGPWALDGDRLWFGKTFYAGEGGTGTGGFGYFDANTRQYQIFSPREITPSSASAIFVQPDAVWVALLTRQEYGDHGQGLLRYDRRSQTTTRFDIAGSIGRRFIQCGDRIALTLDDGIIVIRDGHVTGYIVDQMTDGRLRVAEAFN